MSVNLSLYNIHHLSVEFISDEDPLSSFLRIKVYDPDCNPYNPSATIVIFGENTTVVDRLHDIFLAARSPEGAK